MQPEERKLLVSVVIPAFNAQEYLGRTLDSVLSQTHASLEIVVVDDGSTDETRRIADDYAQRDNRITVHSTENKGVAEARNFGIRNSTGSFIAFVDADDLWHPTKIEKQLAKLVGHGPDWGAVYTLHRVIDQKDQVQQDGPTTVSAGFILGQHLAFKFVRNGSTLLVRREVIEAVGGFEPSYAKKGIGGCEDLDFELRIAARYKMDVVPEMLVGYRRYFGNMSSNRVRMALSLLAVIDRSLSENPKLSPYAKQHALLSSHQYAFMNFSNGHDAFRAAKSLGVLFSNDVFIGFAALTSVTFFYFPRKLVRSLFRRLHLTRNSLKLPVNKFLEMDPAATGSGLVSMLHRRRLKLLQSHDEDYERRYLAPHFDALRKHAQATTFKVGQPLLSEH